MLYIKWCIIYVIYHINYILYAIHYIYMLYTICYILNNFVCVLVCQFCTVSPVFCVICSHHSMPRSPGGGPMCRPQKQSNPQIQWPSREKSTVLGRARGAEIPNVCFWFETRLGLNWSETNRITNECEQKLDDASKFEAYKSQQQKQSTSPGSGFNR